MLLADQALVQAVLGEASPAWVGAHAAILKDHDWVFFTQRGTQGAQPFLDCEGYSLRELNAAHNTLIVVEHDEDTIRQADHIIDLGPGAGVRGGRVIAEGTAAELARNKFSAQ